MIQTQNKMIGKDKNRLNAPTFREMTLGSAFLTAHWR